ncbi:MAG TPA: beta-carotene hydroxylase, partial [Flavobacteriales bacterium]|nr:beta-carotene hydroxylase [Flavobacteriales bacterium]
MNWWFNIGIVAAVFVAMEFVAWAMHRYVMHGFLWVLHRDHHKRDHHHVLERNDAFFLVFAVPSMCFFLAGAL